MATGRLGAADLSATTNTTVYTCPASTFTVATVNLCNRGASNVTVRIAVASSATPGNAEWVEYDATLVPKGTLEKSGLILDSTNKYLVVYSSAATVSAVAMGIETSTL